ncbi:hypothetical protein F8568_016075 [Actinomadura sp. LD22]|uniref:Uncharacterized protein n=1 Tax=Actinomadura physcomitrii TaxID=2650748 RepID=A0A6I4MGW6_9ACTN|nr:hypothetical protein [Actinomadura physcomitrii]MWA01859.1 hypothetical protein [Actinomadura physcomitrii]
MAWQLHYTSARRGPTGRAGFQFVAETPGLPDGVRAAVTPYLSYRPPPDAPLSPDDAELAGFPVSLLYDRVDGRPLLLRCRYLGRDYSGRYGNFFAHAVVADDDELEGLRPAELWHAPLWAPLPGDGDLGELDDLAPGAALDPESLAAWLAGSGPPDAYGTLARLVDAVAGVLGRGHGRIVLVAADVELIARWIAVVSYSLPVAAAARLSFVTYTADPDGAAQRLVGTTPDVWNAVRHHASHALAVDLRAGLGGGDGTSRFARTVAACWHDADFAALDALGELAPLDGAAPSGPAKPSGPSALDGAATLLALCRRDGPVTAAEEGAAAALLSRPGAAVPEWVWRDLAPGVASMGLELALAVHERALASGATGVARECAARIAVLALSDPAARDRMPELPERAGELEPRVAQALADAPDLAEVAAVAAVAVRAGTRLDLDELATAAARRARLGAAGLPAAHRACPAEARAALLDGAVRGLAEAAARDRAAALTPGTCDLLYEHAAERLRAVPEVAVPVLVSIGRRYRPRRIAVTGELLRLTGASTARDADAGAALAEVWAAAPSAAECADLLDAFGTDLADVPALAALPSRTFETLGHDALADAQSLRLAARVPAVLPGGRAAADAAAVRAYADAITASRPDEAARAMDALAGARRASARLTGEAFEAAARRLCRRPPAFRAALLGAVPPPVRARIAGCWTAELPARARAGRAQLRGAGVERRNDLIEIVLRLRARGITEPDLEAWARGAAGRWLAGRQLDARLAGRPELRAALRDLLAGDEGR